MWIVNETNIITIITDEDSSIKLYSRVQGSDDGFTELSIDLEHKGGGVYEAETSFNEAGKHIVKVINETISGVKYHTIEVVSEDSDTNLTQDEHDKLMSIPTADENAEALLDKEI